MCFIYRTAQGRCLDVLQTIDESAISNSGGHISRQKPAMKRVDCPFKVTVPCAVFETNMQIECR